MQATLILPTDEAQRLSQNLPGKPVTGAFLLHHNQVAIMAEATQSIDALLPRYEVVSAQAQPHDAALSRLTIEYRLRVFVCEVCGTQHMQRPEHLHFDGGTRYQRCFCSEQCKQRLVEAIIAERDARHTELGNLIALGMQYLRLRQAVPPEIRAYMTWQEWDELRQECSRVYTAAHQQLVDVLATRAGRYQAQDTQPEESLFRAIEAVPISLF